MAEAGPFSQKLDPGGRVSKCNSPGCICCQHIKDGISSFECKATGELHKIKQKLDCRTSNVIYVIECKRCQIQYVGMTTGRLQRRFRAHLSSIKKGEHRPIPDHYRSECHSLTDVSVFPVEQVDGSKELGERELFWIRELDTVTEGLNLGSYKCVRQQNQDDDSDGWRAPAQGQMEESMESTWSRKRKHCESPYLKSKRKRKNMTQTVYSPETEELFLTCEDAIGTGKEVISQLQNKLQNVSCREEESKRLLKDLKKKISDLKNYAPKEKIYIGLFGRTGAGKSSLINAIVNENQLLPSGSIQACTSVFVHVQANAESTKYTADIEFISLEDWKSELHFLLDIISSSNKQQNTGTETEDKEMVYMAKEKITAIYGEEGLKKSHGELAGARELSEFPGTGMKILNCDTAKELSQSIEPYIQSDNKAEQQFWPLVKRVNIYLPNSPALLDGIVLIDLPGAGHINKHRCEMWKECLSQCSSVWIVSEMYRALSEEVANEIFDKSLRTIAGGGVCHNITYICTKTDNINPGEIKKNYHLTDDDLEIKCIIQDPQYERREKQACIQFRNERLKEAVSAVLKEKTKEFLFGDEDNSDEFFDVYTVSSQEYSNIAQGRRSTLDKNETEIPFLIEHIKKLYVSHFVKEGKDYVSDVSGIISYLHFSKDAISSKEQSSNLDEFTRLEKELVNTGRRLDSFLSKVRNELQDNLRKGAKKAQMNCQRNANISVLESSWSNNRGFHKTLKALCRNDGYYRTGNGEVFDLNYSLSEPMYREINEKKYFQTAFGLGALTNTLRSAGFQGMKLKSEFGISADTHSCFRVLFSQSPGASRRSLHAHFASFQENFIKDDLLKLLNRKNKEKYLRLVYIRTEQRKLLRTLEKEIQQRKKLIYFSLSDSVRDTMKPTYQECSEIRGKNTLQEMKEKLVQAIESSKDIMFLEAMETMLEDVHNLQKYLTEKIQNGMTTSLKVALNQIPDDLTGLPDVTEEHEMMKQCCESLNLQIF